MRRSSGRRAHALPPEAACRAALCITYGRPIRSAHETRGTGRLTALAWAVIAAREVGDRQKQSRYAALLDDEGADIRFATGREPLFFCPTTKGLVNFDTLKANALRANKSA